MLAIFAVIVCFAYFAITEFNKESALTALQSTQFQSEGLTKVLAERRQYLDQQRALRSKLEDERKYVDESKRKIEFLQSSEASERAELLSIHAKLRDTQKQYIDSVRSTVQRFVGQKIASVRLMSGKSLSNLTLTDANEDVLTFRHDAGITKVMNADLSEESRILFGLPDKMEFSQISTGYKDAAQRNTDSLLKPEKVSGTGMPEVPSESVGNVPKTITDPELDSLEAQLAAIEAQRDKLLGTTDRSSTEVQTSSLKSREAIAEKLSKRMLELQMLIKNAKGQP